MTSDLRDIFFDTSLLYLSDPNVVDQTWETIVDAYQQDYRHYHTFSHLRFIFERLNESRHLIADWDSIVFAIFFHDVVYNVLKKDNEYKSGICAREYLTAIKFIPQERIDHVQEMIMATAGHEMSSVDDINLFTDADLSILGTDHDTYQVYQAGIRKEYKWYPDLLYKPGRKKVIKHFLSMEKIFKTQAFARFEDQARINLQSELSSLE